MKTNQDALMKSMHMYKGIKNKSRWSEGKDFEQIYQFILMRSVWVKIWRILQVKFENLITKRQMNLNLKSEQVFAAINSQNQC